MPDQNSVQEKETLPDTAERAIVKWFSPAKGYGFVLVADPKNGALADLFLHIHVVRAARILVDSQQILMVERGKTNDGRPCVSKIYHVVSDGPIISERFE